MTGRKGNGSRSSSATTSSISRLARGSAPTRRAAAARRTRAIMPGAITATGSGSGITSTCSMNSASPARTTSIRRCSNTAPTLSSGSAVAATSSSGMGAPIPSGRTHSGKRTRRGSSPRRLRSSPGLLAKNPRAGSAPGWPRAARRRIC